MNDIILSTQNGEPVVSSREVAKNFGKEHKDVLKAINNLVAQNCAAKSMFHLSDFENRGKKYPMYLRTAFRCWRWVLPARKRWNGS